MSNSALNLPPSSTSSRDEVDVLFLEIFEQLGVLAIRGAASCTQAVFDLSSHYLSKPAFDALKRFHDLYFDCSAQLETNKNEVNAHVTEVVALLQAKMEAGEAIHGDINFEESERLKQQRVSLAAVQRQLEGILVLDTGIRDEILPALSLMQFEDAVRQRIQHLISAWWRVLEFLPLKQGEAEVAEFLRTIAKTLSSVEETNDFYTIVLREEPPQGLEQRSIFLEF